MYYSLSYSRLYDLVAVVHRVEGVPLCVSVGCPGGSSPYLGPLGQCVSLLGNSSLSTFGEQCFVVLRTLDFSIHYSGLFYELI